MHGVSTGMFGDSTSAILAESGLYLANGKEAMTKITVPNEIGQQLANVQNSVRVCDESGHTIGLFTPAANLDLEPKISDEELDRRANEEPLYRTSEVLARLRSL